MSATLVHHPIHLISNAISKSACMENHSVAILFGQAIIPLKENPVQVRKGKSLFALGKRSSDPWMRSTLAKEGVK